MHKKALSILLVAGVSLTALSAAAKSKTASKKSGPTVKVTGVLRTLAAGVNQKIRTSKGVQFNTYGNATLNAGGTADNGLSYGVIAVLQLDRSKSVSDKPISEAYTYISSDSLGSIQFGDTNGAESLLMYDGTDVMGGTGGFDANLDKQLNITRGVNFAQDVGASAGGFSRATKLTYISPDMDGFQMGISYTPETSQYGRRPNTNSLQDNGKPYAGKNPYATNQMSGGLSYTQEYGISTVGVYMVGVLGKAKGPRGTASQGVALNSVKAFRIGTLVDHGNWQLGGAYFDNGKSYMRRDTHYTNTKGFNVAVGYGMGPANIALGYTATQRKVTDGKAKADIASFTVDYSLADGLAVYGEASYFKFKTPEAHRLNTGAGFNPATDYLDRQPSSNKNNSGSAFVLGTRINF